MAEQSLLGAIHEALVGVPDDVLGVAEDVVRRLRPEHPVADVAGQHEAALFLLDPGHVTGPNLQPQVVERDRLKDVERPTFWKSASAIEFHISAAKSTHRLDFGL